MPLSQIVSASIEDGAVAPVDLSSVAQYTGFKNRIINGAMQFAQRSTSAAMASSTYPSLDRWAVYGGTQGTLSRSSSGLSGFSYAAKIQRNSGSAVTTNLQISQTIESQNMVDLAGQVVTYSFWAKAGANLSSTSSQMYYGLGTGTVADQGGAGSTAGWTGLTYPIGTTNLTITTTWTRYSFQATIPSDALEMVVYLGFFPTGTAGADDSISITGVQLEKGVTATSFDYRPYGTELALCQRYYYKQQAVNTASVFGSGFNNAATNAVLLINFPVTMRTSPGALEQTGTAANYSVYYQGGSAQACSSVPIFNTGDVWSATVLFTVASGLTSGQASMARANNVAAYLAWSAEL